MTTTADTTTPDMDKNTSECEITSDVVTGDQSNSEAVDAEKHRSKVTITVNGGESPEIRAATPPPSSSPIMVIRPQNDNGPQTEPAVASTVEVTVESKKKKKKVEEAESSKESSDWCGCIGIKTRIVLICLLEMLAITYQLTTSILIFTSRNNVSSYHQWIWYSQPYLAYIWLHDPQLVFVLTLLFLGCSIVAVVLLLQALDSNNALLVVPHLVMQVVCVILLTTLSIITVVYMSAHGHFAIRVADLTGTTMSNGFAGIGNILYGIEEYNQDVQRRRERTEQLRNRLMLLNTPLPPETAVRQISADVSDASKPLAKVVRKPAVFIRRHFTYYQPGLHLLVALCTFVTMILLDLVFLVVTVQAYYYLRELHKLSSDVASGGSDSSDIELATIQQLQP